jgi:hypothetical protein
MMAVVSGQSSLIRRQWSVVRCQLLRSHPLTPFRHLILAPDT